jgi:predicted nucleotidyltransferase
VPVEQNRSKGPLSIDSILRLIRSESSRLRDLGVEHVYVFGSRCHGNQRVDSDVDVLVKFSDGPHGGFFDLARVKGILEKRLSVEVDVQFADAVPPWQDLWKDVVVAL